MIKNIGAIGLLTTIFILLGFGIQAQTTPLWIMPDIECTSENCSYTVRVDENNDLYTYARNTRTLYISPADGSPVEQFDLTGIHPFEDFIPFSSGYVVFMPPDYNSLHKYDLQSGQTTTLDMPFDIESCNLAVLYHTRGFFKINGNLAVCGQVGTDATLNFINISGSTPIIDATINMGNADKLGHFIPPWSSMIVGLDGNIYMGVADPDNSVFASFNVDTTSRLATHYFVLRYVYNTAQWELVEIPINLLTRPWSSEHAGFISLIAVDEQGNFYYWHSWRDNQNNRFLDIVKYDSQGVFVGTVNEQDIGGTLHFGTLLSEDSFLLFPVNNISNLNVHETPMNLPFADAGTDQTTTDIDGNGTESVTLDGSLSSDSDGTIVSYDWSEGGTVIASGVNPQVDLGVGIHTITLTVTDDDGATGVDDVVITVEAPPVVTCDTTIVSGDVTGLISAIDSADNTPEADTICLEAGTYTLPGVNNSSNGLPQITTDISLVGLDAGATLYRDGTATAFRHVLVGGTGHLSLENVVLVGIDISDEN